MTTFKQSIRYQAINPFTRNGKTYSNLGGNVLQTRIMMTTASQSILSFRISSTPSMMRGNNGPSRSHSLPCLRVTVSMTTLIIRLIPLKMIIMIPPLPDDPAIPIPSLFMFPRGDNPVTGGVNAFPGGDTAVIDNGHPRRNVGTYKDGPTKIRRLPIDGKSYELAYPTDAPFSSLYPVPVISNTAGRPSNYHPKERLNKQFLTECYFFKTHGFKNRIVSPPSLITCLLTIGAMGWTVFSSMISLTRIF
jgi:hypothetical protein